MGAKLGTIAGIVPSLVGEVSGCTFRTRCEHARASCRSAIPRHLTDEGRHAFRCVDPQGFAPSQPDRPLTAQSQGNRS
nr:oligopeptide/dipeptide ABC transporter ATP-binding protein [Pseudophaeobacter leonis]